MSEMHEVILDLTTRIFKENCTKELIDTLDDGKWPKELWDLLVESGITSIGVSDSVGGTGGDFIDAFHIMQLAGKYAVPLPISETIIVNWLIASYGGEISGDSAYTYDLNMESNIEIEEKDGGFYINGMLKNIPWARSAQKILTLTNLRGKSVIVILPLEQAAIELNQNIASEPLDSLNFENVYLKSMWFQPVSKEEIVDKIMNIEGLTKSSMMSGAMEKVLELSIQYSSEREQFGRPLHRFQAIQQHLATLASETVSTLTIVNETIALFNKSKNNVDYEIAATKIRANEAVEIITNLAHQIHGAIGMTHEHNLHQYTRRLWAWREEGGNEKYWTKKMTDKIMTSRDNTLWSIMTEIH